MIPTVSWDVVVLFNCNWPPETPNDSLCLAVRVSQHHVGGSQLFLARLILIVGPANLVLKDLNIWCWCLDCVIGTVELKHVLCCGCSASPVLPVFVSSPEANGMGQRWWLGFMSDGGTHDLLTAFKTNLRIWGGRESATMAFLAHESLTGIYWRQLHQRSVNRSPSRGLRTLKAIHLCWGQEE